MRANFSVTGHAVSGSPGPHTPQPSRTAEGSWQGRRITLAPAGTAQAVLRGDSASTPALPTVQIRDLFSRRVAAEPSAFVRMAPTQIFQRARILGVDIRSLRAGARSIFSGKPAAAGAGRGAAKTRYLALQLAEACLGEDMSDEEVTALLTHTGEGDGRESEDDLSPESLAELLRHAANDEQELRELVENALDGMDLTAEDEEKLTEDVHRARHDDEKLMEVLREAQKLPSVRDASPEEKRIRLRQVQDTIREFERSNEGPEVLARFNTALVAAVTADPASFLDVYAQLVSQPRSFAAALKFLLGHYSLEDLDGALGDLKKALGDDLSAATPSHDTRRLGAALADLGNMALSSTLIASVRELIALLRRREEQKRRKRPDADDGDDGDDGGSESEEKSSAARSGKAGRHGG